MKVLILLYLCTIYSASCYVITIPLEDMENAQNNKMGPMPYSENLPDNEVEVFSPSELNYHNMITPEVKKPAAFEPHPIDDDIIDDWEILSADIENDPLFKMMYPSDGRKSLIFNPPVHQREYDTSSNENDDNMFKETVLVNGMPTELSQKRSEDLNRLYETAFLYHWLMRYCMTHPSCNTETLVELLMTTRQQQDIESGYFDRH